MIAIKSPDEFFSSVSAFKVGVVGDGCGLAPVRVSILAVVAAAGAGFLSKLPMYGTQ
jgi:hypothetical protein